MEEKDKDQDIVQLFKKKSLDSLINNHIKSGCSLKV